MIETIKSEQRLHVHASRHSHENDCIQGRILKSSTSALRQMVIFSVVVLWHCVAMAQAPPPAHSNTEQEYTLKLHANIVLLNATVLDRHNELVSGLGKDNFRIYEDGTLQQIKHFSSEDLPVTVGILVDNSGSMKTKRDDVIAAALAFARSSNTRDQMFVVNFNEHVTFGLPANVPFTDKRDQLQRALAGIRAVGQTAMYDGIIAGLDHLKMGKHEKKVLIVISDGDDNASKYRLAQVMEMAKQSAATIYTIGIFDENEDEDDRNHSVLKHIAKVTGGEAFFPTSSNEIRPICEKIARDIRNQYALTYTPNMTASNGSYRTIEVKADAPGHGRLSVRTRPGYFVSSAPSLSEAR